MKILNKSQLAVLLVISQMVGSPAPNWGALTSDEVLVWGGPVRVGAGDLEGAEDAQPWRVGFQPGILAYYEF